MWLRLTSCLSCTATVAMLLFVIQCTTDAQRFAIAPPASALSLLWASSATSAGYFRTRMSDRPAALLDSFTSIVPSLSGSAALKRFSTIARNSFLSTSRRCRDLPRQNPFHEPTAQFASVEGAIMIAVELVEQLSGRRLCFREIDCTVIIGIECFQ